MKNIFKDVDYKVLNLGKEINYTDIEYDSRKIIKKWYICCP